MKRKQNLYFAEITDLFDGQANYSWATRHKIKASSARGALIKLNRDCGLGFRSVGCERYDSRSGATCAFITEWDDDYHSRYMNTTDNLA